MVTETSTTVENHPQPSLPLDDVEQDSCITVLLPSHNGEAYLATAIESVLNQTHRNLRLVIIDDASTDTTGQIAQQYADQDERVEWLQLAHQHGLANALNIALSRSVHTAWFAIQNDDDWWHPEKLEKQWAFIQTHPEHSVVGTAAWLIDPSGQPLDAIEVPTSAATIRLALCASDCMLTPSTILNTHIVKQVGGFGSGWNYSEDYLLWTKMLKLSEMANIPESLYHYRWHGGNMSVVQGNYQVMDSIRITQRYVNDTYHLGIYRDHGLFWYPPQYQRQYLAYKRQHLHRVAESIYWMTRLMKQFRQHLQTNCIDRQYARTVQLTWLDHALYGLSWRQRWWVYMRIVPVTPLAYWLRQGKRLWGLCYRTFAIVPRMFAIHVKNRL